MGFCQRIEDYNVGDICVKRYGTKPFRITDIYGSTIHGRFLHNNGHVYIYGRDEIKPYDGEIEEKSAPSMKTLYSFTDESGNTEFGIHVGTNSQNLFILEVRGVDGYVVKDPNELEEVLPYTFSVAVNGKETHYIGEPGRVNEGDWLIMDSGSSYSIAQVKAIDTKFKKAKEKFKGRRILTEPV